MQTQWARIGSYLGSSQHDGRPPLTINCKLHMLLVWRCIHGPHCVRKSTDVQLNPTWITHSQQVNQSFHSSGTPNEKDFLVLRSSMLVVSCCFMLFHVASLLTVSYVVFWWYFDGRGLLFLVEHLQKMPDTAQCASDHMVVVVCNDRNIWRVRDRQWIM